MRLICICNSEDDILNADFLFRYSNLYSESIKNFKLITILFNRLYDFDLFSDDIVINYRIYDTRINYISNKCSNKKVICGIDIDNNYFFDKGSLYGNSLVELINRKFDFCVLDSIYLKQNNYIEKIKLPKYKYEINNVNNVNLYSIKSYDFWEKKKKNLKINFININNINEFFKNVFKESIYLYDLYQNWNHFTLDLYTNKNNLTGIKFEEISFIPININVFDLSNKSIIDILIEYEYIYLYTAPYVNKKFYRSLFNLCGLTKTIVILNDRYNLFSPADDMKIIYKKIYEKNKIIIFKPNSNKTNMNLSKGENIFMENKNLFKDVLNKKIPFRFPYSSLDIFILMDKNLVTSCFCENNLIVNLLLLNDIGQADLGFIKHDSEIYLKMSIKFVEFIKKYNFKLFLNIKQFLIKNKKDDYSMKFKLFFPYINFSRNEFEILNSSIYLNQLYFKLINSLRFRNLIKKFFVSLFTNINLFYF